MAYQYKKGCYGYTTGKDTAEHTAVNIIDPVLQKDIQSFPFLEQWEIARFCQPQGPLDPADGAFRRKIAGWSKRQMNAQQLNEELQHLCRSRAIPILQIPPRTPASFFRNLAAQGGEEAADAAGVLIFRGQFSLRENDLQPTLYLAPPTIGGSCRLWRKYPARRLLRVSFDKDLTHELASSERKHARQIRRFREWIGKPLLHLGILYRVFYAKEGTLYFWGESCTPEIGEPFPAMPLFDFLDQIIPVLSGVNDGMTLAKLSARVKLWLSKTESRGSIDQVRWVPDLTNHTLAIGSELLAQVCLALGLSYVPSCIAGEVNGEHYTWALRKDEPYRTTFINVFGRTMMGTTKEGWLEAPASILIDFYAYVGHARTYKRARVQFAGGQLCSLPDPEGAEEIMTDGNGLMSYALAHRVTAEQGLETIPTAIQARVGGCKGLWNLELQPDSSDELVWIEIRDSQFKCSASDDSEWEFEVCNVSATSRPSNLGEQMTRVFVSAQAPENNLRISERLNELLQEDAEAVRLSLLSADTPAQLRGVVEKMENVQAGRDGQMLGGAIAHFGDREEEDANLLGGEILADHTFHPLSGRPRTLGEQAIAMLDAGFWTDYAPLETVLGSIEKGRPQSESDKTMVPVGASRFLYVVTDPWGILKEGEIFVQLSGDGVFDPITKLKKPSVLDEFVLIARNPCIQPSDVQKVRAIYHPAFSTLHDVVVCSTRGSRSVLSKLSGGDYDGDGVLVVFDPILVDAWKDKNDRYLEAPYKEEEYFETVQQHVAGHPVSNVGELRDALPTARDASLVIQEVMLAPLYTKSSFGELNVEQGELYRLYGLFNMWTVTLGHLFTAALDAPKAGRKLRFTIPEIRTRLGYDKASLAAQKTLAPLKTSNLTVSPPPLRKSDSGTSSLDSSVSSASFSLSPQAKGFLDLCHGMQKEQVKRKKGSVNASEDEHSPTRYRHEAATTIRGEDGDVSTDTVIAATPSPNDRRCALGSPVASANDSGVELSSGPARVTTPIFRTPDRQWSRGGLPEDEDLAKPWYDAVADAGGEVEPGSYLALLEEHIMALQPRYSIYKQHLGRFFNRGLDSRATGGSSSWTEVEKARKVRRDDQRKAALVLDELVRTFVELPEDVSGEFEIGSRRLVDIAASCAHVVSARDSRLRDLPHLVAFRTLMNLKADAVDARQTSNSLGARKVTEAAYLSLKSAARKPRLPRAQTGATAFTPSSKSLISVARDSAVRTPPSASVRPSRSPPATPPPASSRSSRAPLATPPTPSKTDRPSPRKKQRESSLYDGLIPQLTQDFSTLWPSAGRTSQAGRDVFGSPSQTDSIRATTAEEAEFDALLEDSAFDEVEKLSFWHSQ